MNNKGKHQVLVIPDLHEPFAHKDAVEFLKWAKKKYSPDIVVNLGDEVDFHAISDYDTDPDGLSAGKELQLAIEKLKPYYDLFPKVKVCTSNHSSRPFRQAYKYGLPKALIKDYKEFLETPSGWEYADSWEIDGIKYEHGEGFSGAQGALKSALANMQSTVIGHLHSFAGIAYSANDKHLIYGFNVGCLIDRHSYAFSYGKKIKNKPILGCGIITKGIPTFIPMILNSKGRWIKNAR